MWNHIDMLRTFLEDPRAPDYGIFCEDDVYIRRDFGILLPVLAALYRAHGLDVFLLGYLEPTRVAKVVIDEPHRFPNTRSALPDLVVRGYDDSQWGAEMYMMDRRHAQVLVSMYTTDFAHRSVLRQDDLPPFSPDWTITKFGNKALVYPMMAVEEGEVVADDDAHRRFHAVCAQIQFDPDVHI
jgi:hypothetical protein